MKKFHPIQLTGIGVLALLVLFALYLIHPLHKEFIITDHPVIASTEAVKHETISQYPGIDLHMKSEENSRYTISLSVPSFEAENIHQEINQWIENERELFLKETENNKQNKFQTHLNVRLEIRQHNEDIYGLTFYSYKYTGGANGEESVRPFVINLAKDTILDFKDVFSFSDENIDQNLPIVIKKVLEQNEELKPFIHDELLKETLAEMDQVKWSVDQQRLFVFFNESEVATGAPGALRLDVPLQEFQVLLEEYEKKEQKEAEEKRKIKEAEKRKRDSKQKIVALTFDDGPSPDVTPQILNTLQEFEAKATFFMLGSQVEFYPQLAEQVASLGHEIASHSYHHPDLTTMDDQKIKEEFKQTSKEIKKATGREPKLFRPPYGAYNDRVIHYADHYDYAIVLWSIDALDWKHQNADEIIKIVMEDLTDGAIILLHDIHQSTADALPELLTSLQKEGYTFVTVSELLSSQEKEGVGPYHGKYSQ